MYGIRSPQRSQAVRFHSDRPRRRSAFGALVAAGAAVGTLIVAVVAVLAAFRQVAEARVLRQEQAQPYVAVYMEPSAATGDETNVQAATPVGGAPS